MIKQSIKKIQSRIHTKLDDFMGNPMIYDYQKVLFKLTIVLFIGIFFVIRGSTTPLLIQNKILHWLLYSDPNGDKTTYNIGISIIAAYLFYLVQVYIPEKRKVKRKMIGFSEEHRHEIYLIHQYILAWKQFLKEKGICQFREFDYELNHNDGGELTKEIYNETIEEIVECLERIIKSPEFADSDSSYTDFIINSRCIIDGHLKFMDDQFPRWYDTTLNADDYELILSIVIKDMERVQNRLSYIERYYLETLTIMPHNRKSELQKFSEKL